jgi:hypothetical protein
MRHVSGHPADRLRRREARAVRRQLAHGEPTLRERDHARQRFHRMPGLVPPERFQRDARRVGALLLANAESRAHER